MKREAYKPREDTIKGKRKERWWIIDAYSHMHHFYLRSTSKKKTVKQERAWELSYFLLLCEFKDFRHHEEVKQVAKIWRKVIFLPEELVPDSSLRKVIFVLIFWTSSSGPTT